MKEIGKEEQASSGQMEQSALAQQNNIFDEELASLFTGNPKPNNPSQEISSPIE
jgi:hypothetical protein